MRNRYFCVIVFIFGIMFSGANLQARNATEALEAALALNYCHMSLYRIIQYNDRIVLDEEYNEIISNINLTKIRDEEIIELLQGLMDTISQFRLNEGDKKLLYAEYENQLSNAFYSSFSSVTSIPLSGNPYALAATALVQAGSAYVNYRNNMEMYKRQLDRSIWELDKKAILSINDIRKDFLKSYWVIMRRYNIPDRWRITEKQMHQYMSILKDTDPGRKFRNLQRLENSFQAYPPFWYYLGQAAQDLHNHSYAIRAYQRLKSNQMGFFREDNIYASALMNETSILDSSNSRRQILDNLKIINEQSPLDYRKNIFSALWYMNYGEYDRAKERLRINVDNDKNTSINRQLIGNVYLKKNDERQFRLLVDQMLSSDKICNEEVLYLLGPEPELKTLQKIRDQIINIQVVIDERTFREDVLIIRVPDKWIFWDNKDFTVRMIMDNLLYSPAKMTVDQKKKLVSYHFARAVDSGDILKNRKTVQVSFDFISTAYPVTLVGDLTVSKVWEDRGVMRKAYGKTGDYLGKAYDKAKSWTPWKKNGDSRKSEDNVQAEDKEKTVRYFVEYKKREIRTKENCYHITPKNEIAKCK